MATFPAIKPSSRSFNPGDYPTQRYRTMSGATWKRNFGSTRVGMALNLEFLNIPDEKTAAILQHYNGEGGTINRFPVPGEIWAGMSTALEGLANVPANVQWAYAEPPDVESVFIGISKVRVKLVGEAAYG